MDQHGAGGDPAAYEPLLSSLIEIKKKITLEKILSRSRKQLFSLLA